MDIFVATRAATEGIVVAVGGAIHTKTHSQTDLNWADSWHLVVPNDAWLSSHHNNSTIVTYFVFVKLYSPGLRLSFRFRFLSTFRTGRMFFEVRNNRTTDRNRIRCLTESGSTDDWSASIRSDRYN